DFPQFVDGDGADSLNAHKQDCDRLLRTLEVFHERSMVDARPVLVPNGPRMSPIYVADDCHSDDGCGWAGGVDPESCAGGDLRNAASQFDGFRSVQDRIRISGMD